MEQVERLIADQFPSWSHLPIRPVDPGGWDNRTFHLGETMSVRMPSAERYVPQVAKEYHWLPLLAPHLPVTISCPLEVGEPGHGYPWQWSIYEWLPGTSAADGENVDLLGCARDLAEFLSALQAIELPGELPHAGPHNFYRGGELAVYDAETKGALESLGSEVEGDVLRELWESALATHWSGTPVWLHGDLSPTNLLGSAGRLSAVIDFGGLGVGDPACDLTIAWTFFTGASRAVFQEVLEMDENTWLRAKAWGVWKALITLADREVDEEKHVVARRVLAEILADDSD